MPSKPQMLQLQISGLLLLLCAMSVMGCATPSSIQSLPVTSRQVQIVSKPVVIEPKPQGAYWSRHCELVKSVQATQKTLLPESEVCRTLGMP